ncbi:MAG: glycosyltransferase family 4 protein [Candidatus Andersenbacteria bacterium]|nr:glycosyltransferase family 4 protein [Candidatus Andersenbacteria bacterium]
MNLLLINNEFPPIGGGGSTVTKYALRYLVKAGHTVTLITSSYKDLPKRETIEGATVIRIPAVRRFKDYCSPWELVIFGISALFYTAGFVARHKVDFIQAYFAVPAGWVAWIIHMFTGPPFRRAGIPYAIYFGGSDVPGSNPSRYKYIYPLITPLLKMVWRPATFRTVCSKELVRLGNLADPDSQFICIPNGVETARFTPINRPPNPKVKLLFIGRLIYRKGLQRVVQALPEVKARAKVPFEIEVVGTGAARADLDKLAETLGVTDLIHYVGMVPYDELERSYQYADVFVLTSLSEGMPSVILEAMGCGLPIVASDVGGNNEIVHDGVNGYLIDASDEMLAERLITLINDRDLRVRMGAKSQEIAREYDWANIMGKYNEMYLKTQNTKIKTGN